MDSHPWGLTHYHHNNDRHHPITLVGCISHHLPMDLCVIERFDQFLLDHAAAEKKAAGMALSMLSHYPDRARLVTAMSELAAEEMMHFREVVKLIQERGLQLTADEKDPYINEIRSWIRQGSEEYLLDRLLTGAVIEARGAERFALVAEALSAGLCGAFTNLWRALKRATTNYFLISPPSTSLAKRWHHVGRSCYRRKLAVCRRYP